MAHAKADGQSLQQYLLARLEAFAATLTAREGIERWEAGLRGSPSLSSPTAADAAAEIRATREERTGHLTKLASTRRPSAKPRH